MIKAAIIGATGYAGAELVRILSRHPQVTLGPLTSRSSAGKPYYQMYQHFYQYTDLVCSDLNISAVVEESDVIFTALPHGNSMEIAAEVMKQGKKIVDLGADFRLNSQEQYQEWYKVEHKAPQLLAKAVYGLPEINRQQITGANLIANPGCYPTTAILGLAPLLANKLIDVKSIIIDSKSGVSGGGRGLSLMNHYAEVNENFQAYKVVAHRHIPEIEQEISKIAHSDITISFTPHLVPMTRGMLSTIYANLAETTTTKGLNDLYQEYYQDEFFVRVLPEEILPQTKALSGSNFCHLGVKVDPRTNRIIVLSAIDNLVKGAAGQAVQNMNLIFGLEEKTGLEIIPLYP